MIAVPAVVHKKMHYQAGENEKQGPPTVEVSSMLGQQIKSTDCQKSDQHKVRARGKEAAFFAFAVIHAGAIPIFVDVDGGGWKAPFAP